MTGDPSRSAASAPSASGGSGPVYDLVCLSPGEAYETEFAISVGTTQQIDCVGTWEAEASYRPRPRAKRKGEPDGSVPQPTPLDLKVSCGFLRILTDPEEGADAKPATLETAVPRPDFERGARVPFDLVLKGLDAEEGIEVFGPAAGAAGEGFWAALIDAQGDVVILEVFGSWADKGFVPGTKRVKAGDTVTAKGSIPADLPRGTYRLVAGYSVDRWSAESYVQRLIQKEAQAGGRDFNEVAARLRAETTPPWQGDLTAPAVEIRITEPIR